jgi:HAD superfamily hydrolase (TIGR01509 family)
VTFLIFDCDGVLVDSESIALRLLVAALMELDMPHDFAECRRLFMGKSVKDVLAEIENRLGSPVPAGWGSEMHARLLAQLKEELQPVEYIVGILAKLPYPRCVASSSPPERIRLSLEVTGLAPLFGERVFSATQVENGKPAPDLFLYAAKECGAAPKETIVIEDSVAGIIAARSAGMAAIGFAGASHADAKLAKDLAAAGANEVLRKMPDLPEAIERIRAAMDRAP